MLFIALPALAEQNYYTWVDAQGNVHNSPVTSSQTTPPNTSKRSVSVEKDAAQDSNKRIDITDKKSPRFSDIDPEDFPSEEDYQQNLNDKPDSEKAFYTWVGADGVIRSEVKPDVMIEFTATERVYDAAFAPPFRLPDYVTEGLCCESYSEYFTNKLYPKNASSFKIEKGSKAFKTQDGNVSAAYLSIVYPAAQETLTIKAFKMSKSSVFEIIGLSKDFKPLYLASNVRGSFVEETWKDIAYKQAIVEMSDVEIKHMIVFVKNESGVSESNYLISISRDTLTPQ